MNRSRPAAGADRAAQNAQTLKALVKLESNKVCADCKRNKHPRWASWNLGVFVCIRCSGIHRGMGTHISRVKSVDLDAWTDEQLQSILKWGNARANKYWEAKLQTGHVPSEAKIENFIRTKYESKRWVMDGPMPDPSTLGDDDDVPLNIVQDKAKIERSASQRQASNVVRQPPPAPAAQPRPQANINLFDDDFDLPARPSTTDVMSSKPAQIPQPVPQPASKPASQSSNLMGLDFFGAPQPAGIGRPSSAASNPAQGNNARSDLKSSILSLYASAPKPQPAPQPSHDRQSSFSATVSAPAQKQDAFGGLVDTFGGMSFPSTSNARPPPPVQSPNSSFSFAATTSLPPQSSGLAGLNFSTAVPTKAAPSAPQVSSPPPLSGGHFFSGTTTKPPAPKPAAAPVPQQNALNFSFTQQVTRSSPPSVVSKPATSIPADLFDDNGFSNFASGSTTSAAPAAKVLPPPMQSPPALNSPFNLSSTTTSTAKPALAQQTLRPTVTAQSSSAMFDPWGGADTNAWGALEHAKPAAPKVELGNVPSKITANDISGGWGAPISSSSNKPAAQPTVAADEDFGGWTSAATPAATKPSGGFGGGSDPFDNPWG